MLLFHLKEFQFDWKTVDDLHGIPIGITAKNHYGPTFHRALDDGKLTVYEASKDDVQFDKLLRHRIKVFPMNVYTGHHMIREKFNPEKTTLFSHHPRPLKTSVYHVMFSRKAKGCAGRLGLFNEGLRQLKASGEYSKIVSRYMREYLPQKLTVSLPTTKMTILAV